MQLHAFLRKQPPLRSLQTSNTPDLQSCPQRLSIPSADRSVAPFQHRSRASRIWCWRGRIASQFSPADKYAQTYQALFRSFRFVLSSSLRRGRGGKIRTCDPLFPKQMRYQAALRPDTPRGAHLGHLAVDVKIECFVWLNFLGQRAILQRANPCRLHQKTPVPVAQVAIRRARLIGPSPYVRRYLPCLRRA